MLAKHGPRFNASSATGLREERRRWVAGISIEDCSCQKNRISFSRSVQKEREKETRGDGWITACAQKVCSHGRKKLEKRKTVGMKSAKVSIDGDVGESLIAVLTVN